MSEIHDQIIKLVFKKHEEHFKDDPLTYLTDAEKSMMSSFAGACMSKYEEILLNHIDKMGSDELSKEEMKIVIKTIRIKS